MHFKHFWQLFTFLPGEGADCIAVCKMCKKQFNMQDNTNDLSGHIDEHILAANKQGIFTGTNGQNN